MSLSNINSDSDEDYADLPYWGGSLAGFFDQGAGALTETGGENVDRGSARVAGIEEAIAS